MKLAESPGLHLPINVFPALRPSCVLLCGGILPTSPCRLRPHHTSNLQNPIFPFNVGRGAGKGQRAGLGGIQKVGLRVPGMRGPEGDWLSAPTSLLGPGAGSSASGVHSFRPGPQTSTEPGCLRCRCRSWTLCSSFFWWPASVMPRAGRSLMGKEQTLSQLLQDPRHGPGRPWPCARRLPAHLSLLTPG